MGITSGSIVISSVIGCAHSPALGVKVNVDAPGVPVLMIAGFHVPDIPSIEVVGSGGAVVF